jgi:putative ABC transport system permease protein
MGTVLGLVLGHVATEVLGWFLREAQQVEITGLAWTIEELWLLALAVGLGLVAALLPAFQAYRIDIARTLAQG